MKRCIYPVILFTVILVLLSGCENLPLGPPSPRSNPFDPEYTPDPADNGGTAETFKVYYADRYSAVYRCNADGTDNEVIRASIGEVWGIAVDEANERLYEADEGDEFIRRSTLLGLNAEEIVSGSTLDLYDIHSLAIDPVHGYLFFADDTYGKIYRSGLDGSSPVDITPAGVTRPLGLNVDTGASKLYWVDWGTQKIQRSNLDGSGLEDILTSVTDPVGLSLDTVNGKLYWTDWTNDHIRRCDLSGSNVETILSGLNDPWEIAVDPAGSRIFYTQQGSGTVSIAALDGSNSTTIVTGVSDIRGICIYPGQ